VLIGVLSAVGTLCVIIVLVFVVIIVVSRQRKSQAGARQDEIPLREVGDPRPASTSPSNSISPVPSIPTSNQSGLPPPKFDPYTGMPLLATNNKIEHTGYVASYHLDSNNPNPVANPYGSNQSTSNSSSTIGGVNEYQAMEPTQMREKNATITKDKNVYSVSTPIPQVAKNYEFQPKNNFEVDYRELEFEREIGRGSGGVVYKGRWRGGGVAIKRLDFKINPSDKELNAFRDEAKLMAALRPHVNVVQFLGITVSPAPLCIVTEFLDQGSLFSYIHSDSKIDSNILVNFVKGITAGMLHLHREGIVHRDLASRNILLGSGFQVKVSDFGMSRYQSEEEGQTTKTDTGPLKWMSPEAIKSRRYSKASDVWSYGVTLYEIVSRQNPYPDMDPIGAALEVTHNNLTPTIPAYTPPLLAFIMKGCFEFDPERRPNFAAIMDRLQQGRMDEWTFQSKEEDVLARSSSELYSRSPPPKPANQGASSAEYNVVSSVNL